MQFAVWLLRKKFANSCSVLLPSFTIFNSVEVYFPYILEHDYSSSFETCVCSIQRLDHLEKSVDVWIPFSCFFRSCGNLGVFPGHHGSDVAMTLCLAMFLWRVLICAELFVTLPFDEEWTKTEVTGGRGLSLLCAAQGSARNIARVPAEPVGFGLTLPSGLSRAWPCPHSVDPMRLHASV